MKNYILEDVKRIIDGLDMVFNSDPYSVVYSEVTKQHVRQFLQDLKFASKNPDFSREKLTEILRSLNVQYTNSKPSYPTKYPKLERHMSGYTGEYFVCAELGRRNILGLLAPKNNPLYDIVATNKDGSHTVHIQVKTCQQHVHGWSLQNDMVHPKNNNKLFVVLVRLMDTGISYYIWKYDDLAAKLQSRFGPNPTSDKLNLTEKDFDNHELAQTVNNWEALDF